MNLQINHETLLKIMQNEDEVYADMGTDCKDSMIEYYHHVYNLEHNIAVWRFRLEGEDFRARVQEADKLRRELHNAAIAMLSGCNVAAEQLGLEPVANFDPKNTERGEVAAAIFEYVENVVSKDKHHN